MKHVVGQTQHSHDAFILYTLCKKFIIIYISMKDNQKVIFLPKVNFKLSIISRDAGICNIAFLLFKFASFCLL